MAATDMASRSSDQHTPRRPFAAWVKRLTSLKSSSSTSNKKNNANKKAKKTNAAALRNHPYPESGRVAPLSNNSSVDDFATPLSQPGNGNGSYSSFPNSTAGTGALLDSNRSAAPTLATNPETVHSDAGYSRALTGTTAGGAMSYIDGAGHNSTFSSPNQSAHSLTTTLTTIQSSNPLNNSSASNNTSTPQTGISDTPAPAQTPPPFSHQYPVTSQPASAIPAHLAPAIHTPTTYSSAIANNQLTDNASIMTLASSSKRRRRSMDTDASIRALPPRSVWGDSRESLPLSVLSNNADREHAPIRPSVNGIIGPERASIYSSQGISAPALASERNSYYASSHKQVIKDRERDGGADARSINRDLGSDARSVNFDGKSFVGTDGASLRGYEGSIRSGALGHGRQDSIPSAGSPLHSPSLLRRPSGAISFDTRDGRDGEPTRETAEEGSIREE